MGANTFLLQLLPAMSATILIADIPMHLLRKNPDKECKEQITDINMCHQDKEEITENATGSQPQQIEHSRFRTQLAEQIVEHRQQYDDKQPKAHQENG